MRKEDLGTTKLDHILSYIAIGAKAVMKFTSILCLLLLIVHQLVLCGENHPYRAIPLLIVLMLVVSAYGYKLFTKEKR